MSTAKEVMIEDATQKARQAFREIETLIQMHRESNTIPMLGATDIHTAAWRLLNAATGLKELDVEVNPTLEIDEPR